MKFLVKKDFKKLIKNNFHNILIYIIRIIII